MWDSPECIDDVMAEVKTEMFYHRPYRAVFKALAAMQFGDEAINKKTLAMKLGAKTKGGYEEAYVYLTNLQRDHGGFAVPAHYSMIVAETFLRREFVSRGKLMIEAAHNEDRGIDEVKSLAEDITLADQRKVECLVSLGPEVEQIANIALDRCDSGGRGAYGIMSGIRPIDNMTYGFQGSTVTVIAARPGVGKTAIGLQFAINACLNQKKAIIFSGEMSARQLIRRVAGHLANIDHNKFITGSFDEDEKKRIAPAVAKANELDMVVVDANGMKPSQMRSIIQKEGCDIAVVDYIQIMAPENPSRQSREVEVASISRALKGIAKKFDIPVISLCQLNREGANVSPTLQNLRESDAIGNDADLVLMLYRLSDDPADGNKRIVQWNMEKNRHGFCDRGKFWFYASVNKFVCVDDMYDDAV